MQAITQKELEEKIQPAKSWSIMRVDEGSFLLLQILPLFVMLGLMVFFMAIGMATFHMTSLWIFIALFASFSLACVITWRRYKRVLHLYDRADQIIQAWKNYLDYRKYLASLAKPTDSQTALLKQAEMELYWAAVSFSEAVEQSRDNKQSVAPALPPYRLPALPALDSPLSTITSDHIPASYKKSKTLLGELVKALVSVPEPEPAEKPAEEPETEKR